MDQNTFQTKTGTCQVTDTEIILTRDGPKGGLAKALLGESIARSMGVYLIVAFLLLGNAVLSIHEGNFLLAVVLGATAVLLVRGMIKHRNMSATQNILSSEITMIEPHAPLSGLSHGYFIVYFQRNGREYQRQIVVPGIEKEGQSQYEKALHILEQINCRIE